MQLADKRTNLENVQLTGKRTTAVVVSGTETSGTDVMMIVVLRQNNLAKYEDLQDTPTLVASQLR